MSFGVVDRPWDGSWVVVIFSVPEEQRDLRHVLRTRLRWLGFGPMYDGVWVSPRASGDEAAALLGDLGVASATVLSSRVVRALDGGHPLGAWDLDALRGEYEAFVAAFEPLLDRVLQGEVGGAEALVARTRVMDAWRQFPGLDPELPEDALPGGWPRRGAQRIFARVYDALGPIAEVRFQQILAARRAGPRPPGPLSDDGRRPAPVVVRLTAWPNPSPSWWSRAAGGPGRSPGRGATPPPRR